MRPHDALLEGLDGRLEDGVIVGAKMSKSLGNYVGVDEAPLEMFGKLMSISDDLMWRYMSLLSTRSPAEQRALREEVDGGLSTHETSRQGSALRLSVATMAQSPPRRPDEWLRVFSQRELPSDIPEFTLMASDEGSLGISAVLKASLLVSSGGEARRMVGQGAVEVDGEKVQSSHTLSVGGPWP